MEDPEERPSRPEAGSPVRPLGASGVPRDILVPLGLLILAIVVAVVQPWTVVPAGPDPGTTAGSPGAPGASGAAAATPSAEPTPTPTPDPYAELVTTCGYPSGWRASTLQGWLGREAPIRTWTAVDPVPASGADDPRVPFAPVATDLVIAIGYCSPVDEDQPPPTVEVEVWALPDDGAPVPLPDLERLEPAHLNALGGLWLPPATSAVTVGGVVGWAPGRYAIRLVALPYDRWLGVEIEDISGLRASPSIRPSPARSSPAPSGSVSP